MDSEEIPDNDGFDEIYGILGGERASELRKDVLEFRRELNKNIKNRTKNLFDYSQ